MQKQKDINNYKQKMNTEILSLTTDIAGLQKTYEQKCIEKVTIKSKEEEDNDIQSKKVKELSSLIMAMDNLEKVFSNRKAETKLKYNYKLFLGQNGEVKRSAKDEFHLDEDTLKVALAQLDAFALYLTMYKKVTDQFDERYERAIAEKAAKH